MQAYQKPTQPHGKLVVPRQVLHCTRPLKTRYIQYSYCILATKYIKQCRCDVWMPPVNVKNRTHYWEKSVILLVTTYRRCVYVTDNFQESTGYIYTHLLNKMFVMSQRAPAYIPHFPPSSKHHVIFSHSTRNRSKNH